MKLDPSESINNMGNLRLDVLDAADLPSADRNGYSDPYCKFTMDGREVAKTKVQKKTLHPSWNEAFDVSIKSRTAAKFKVSVMDWDFGDSADLLGEAMINLELLEPFRPQEFTYALDGKSGVLRLKMLFKPDYVTRARQGSSTFAGTFAAPGKIVGAPVKGVGMVGGGVVKGASFLRHGFKSKKDREGSNSLGDANIDDPVMSNPTISEPTMTNGNSLGSAQHAAPLTDGSSIVPQTPPHRRAPSFGAASIASVAGGTQGKAEIGSAQFLIQSASGFAPGSKLQIHVKQGSGKSVREIHKTKGIKSSDGQAAFDHEMFKASCAADTPFQIVVKDDKLLGGHELGEAMFYISDSSASQEKVVNVGEGKVTLTTTFMAAAESMTESPRSRRSFLSKRDRNVSGRSIPD